MNNSAGESTRGSTPSRWLGVLTLRSAAALCAVASIITLLILLYTWTREVAGPTWALASLAAALSLLTAITWLVANSIAERSRREKALAQALEQLRQREAAAQAAEDSPLGDDPTGPDLGPWIRVIGAAFPVAAGLAALLGPARLARFALRALSAWRASQAPPPPNPPPQEAPFGRNAATASSEL